MRRLMTTEEVQKEFDKGDHMTQVTMAFALALKKIFDSDQPVDVKADGLQAAVMFYKASVTVYTTETLVKCHMDTHIPMNTVIALLAQKFIEKEGATLDRFKLMMKLFEKKGDET